MTATALSTVARDCGRAVRTYNRSRFKQSRVPPGLRSLIHDFIRTRTVVSQPPLRSEPAYEAIRYFQSFFLIDISIRFDCINIYNFSLISRIKRIPFNRDRRFIRAQFSVKHVPGKEITRSLRERADYARVFPQLVVHDDNTFV